MPSLHKAVFRADASPEIGSGHIHRCLSLARILQDIGWECVFLTETTSLETVPSLSKFPCKSPDSKMQCDVLVVDHYGLDVAYERAMRDVAGQIIVLDDLADREHDCDVLIDQNLGRDLADYNGLVPKDAVRLCGSDYTLLRPEFAEYRTESLARRKEQPILDKGCPHILISLGATNLHNATGGVLGHLQQIKTPLQMTAILGSGALHLDKVRDAVNYLQDNTPHHAALHLDVGNMAELMMQADLAIGAGGTSSWERCCLGLPALVMELAGNQRDIIRHLSACGAAETLGAIHDLRPGDLDEKLTALLCKPEQLAEMSRQAARICDGLGMRRVLPWFLPDSQDKAGAAVRLRALEPEDRDVLYSWQQNPQTRAYARNPAIPAQAEHESWFSGKLSDAKSLPYMILHEGLPAGHIRLDLQEDEGKQFYEISLYMNPDLTGRGIAGAALGLIRFLHADKDIYAEIHPDNKASQKLFKKAGYEKQKGYWRVSYATFQNT